MIVPMTKYDIVLFRDEKERFLTKLQELGLVDITVTGWEPDEQERELMLSIEKHRSAAAWLKTIASREGFEPGRPYANPEEAYEKYLEVSSAYASLTAQIAQSEKEAEELGVWGDYNPDDIEGLKNAGIVLRFFHTLTREFETSAPEWKSKYVVVLVNESEGTTYFVVVSSADDEVIINAQEVKAPVTTRSAKTKETEKLYAEKGRLDKEMARAAASVDMIVEHGEREEEKLRLSQVYRTGREEAEGTLLIMEGWATKETSDKVDKMFEGSPGLFYIKSDPTPEDDTPTLLKNGKFNRMFEIIGGFYSMPKYGSIDLTPFFGIFYALFFGLCLADAGYGLIYFIAGLVLRKKVAPEQRNLANLVTILGLSTTICGVLLDAFFGLKITGWAPLAGLQRFVISENMFVISLAIGIVQILLAMIIKVVVYTRRFGFKYALSTIGWILTLYATLLWGVPEYMKIEPVISTSVYLVIAGVGAFLMLFLNSPGKNPFINFGTGLWNLYNDITGFISDFLSYIRLFAIGLSGGILASVFNQLAVGLSGDIPVLKQIFMILILLVGHGITIFMSTISAFVHPMRLTFVEFYKNTGFEDTQRIFSPLKHNRK